MEIPGTAERVNLHTKSDYNQRIEQQMEDNIAYYAAHPEEINNRLMQLDREWDTERTLEANASTLIVTSVLLGTLFNPRWLFFPAIIGGFLLQHAVQGWCPPLPVLRRLGVRTQTEIERERYALKALRGDFRHVLEGDEFGGLEAREKSYNALRAVR